MKLVVVESGISCRFCALNETCKAAPGPSASNSRLNPVAGIVPVCAIVVAFHDRPVATGLSEPGA